MSPTYRRKTDGKPYGVPLHSVRVEDELWQAATARAADKNETVSDVVRRALRRYIAPPRKKKT